MGFQILNSNNEPISIQELDIEAAAFWNKTVDPKWYANPSPEGTDVFKQQSNWFDAIGHSIHNPEVNYTSGWKNVKCSLWVIQTQGLYNKPEEELATYIQVIAAFNKPYYDLIDHWDAKGYTPKKVD